MALKRDVYKLLEDIVGPDYISEEPAVLDAHGWFYLSRRTVGLEQRWLPRYDAMLLPGSTEEIQAIAKECNKWKVGFKPIATGWGPGGAPPAKGCTSPGGCIGLDLRRMNRILEIDEKGMYAVVEPFVISAQLQAELYKRGLCTEVIGAGANTHALSAGKCSGEGRLENVVSTSNRNVLGVEWVLPTGEIVRIGSLGAGAGFFCGAGPGPSLRALIRGTVGANGAVGVFTKGAHKVYHWPGPPIFPVEGISPNYTFKPIENFKFYHLIFPSWETLGEAGYKIGEAGISMILWRASTFIIAFDCATSIEQAVTNYEQLEPQVEGKGKLGGWLVCIAANTRKEFEYKQKVLKQILKETSGEPLPFVEDNPDVQLGLMSRYLRSSSCVRIACRNNYMVTAYSDRDCIDMHINLAKLATAAKNKYIKAGRVWDTGDFCVINQGEDGRVGHVEQQVDVTPNSEGERAINDYLRDAWEIQSNPKYKCTTALSRPFSYGAGGTHSSLGPRLYNEHLWLYKIKKMLDPNELLWSELYDFDL